MQTLPAASQGVRRLQSLRHGSSIIGSGARLSTEKNRLPLFQSFLCVLSTKKNEHPHLPLAKITEQCPPLEQRSNNQMPQKMQRSAQKKTRSRPLVMIKKIHLPCLKERGCDQGAGARIQASFYTPVERGSGQHPRSRMHPGTGGNPPSPFGIRSKNGGSKKDGEQQGPIMGGINGGW